ncbi:MAG: 4-alpha-glucanotransferase [Alphaproteobacteria bacterium ADurb.Bin438]|nr:MAG: 4-alpha-glucanotransferase [Alphaproteobacteria bacterium ADurb.Bin438]
MPLNLVYAMYDYLSASPNYLFLPQLEDVLGQIQQINLPGTDKEHENWRYKLSLNVEDWLCDERVLKLAMIMKDKYSN